MTDFRMSLGFAALFSLVLVIVASGCTLPGVTPPNTNQTDGNTTEPGVTTTSLSPDLLISDFGSDIPQSLRPSDSFALSATLKNTASAEVTQGGFLRSVEVQFYDFSDYIMHDACPSTISMGTLQPGVEKTVSCQCRVKPKASWPDQSRTSYSQSPKIRVKYSYDLYATLDQVSVMSRSEFARQNPVQKTIASAITGPLTITLKADSIPARADDQIRISVVLNADDPSLIQGPTPDSTYKIGVVRIGVPSGFEIVSKGQFESEGTEGDYTWLTKYGVALDSMGQASLSATVKIPYLPGNSPSETYSFRAVASNFNVIKTASTNIYISAV